MIMETADSMLPKAPTTARKEITLAVKMDLSANPPISYTISTVQKLQIKVYLLRNDDIASLLGRGLVGEIK